MRKLRTQLSLGFALIVMVTVALVSLAVNLCINRQFEVYAEERQKDFADGLANGLSDQYDAGNGEWNLDYIHGFGMVALNDGYILKVYDRAGEVIWDAQNHDMTLCHQIMSDISLRMQRERPDLKGDFVSYRYALQQGGTLIGYVDISYYSPYYLNETDFHFLDSLNHILLLVGAVSLIGAIFAGLILAKRISDPIAKTMDITKEISEGNYSIRFEARVKTQELNELTQAVNHMAGALEEQENLRRRLTTDVAHELRTPLANISSHLEAMMEGVWEPTSDRLQLLFDEVKRITAIVAELEQLRQVESENLKLDKEPVNLLELAGTVCSSFEQELAGKQLTCRIEGEAVRIPGDKNKLHQVIFNLLSNAVKYSSPGGEIKISVHERGENAIVTVEDQGIGIPQKDLPLIFQRFYRADASRSRKTGGAGIGLTIVEAIVRAHNGTVSVESEEGKGSCFQIALPHQTAENLTDVP